MTGADLKEQIERYMDVTLKDNTIIDGINEAINKLGVKNHLIATEETTVEADTKISLPDNLIRVIKVEIPEENEYYYNYLIDGNKIRFGDENTYVIYYQKHPEKITGIDTDLGLHPMIESCIKTYLKGYLKLRESEQNEVGWNYIKQFKAESKKAYMILKRNQKTPSKVRVKRHA